jgi:micrococcal nuclease
MRRIWLKSLGYFAGLVVLVMAGVMVFKPNVNPDQAVVLRVVDGDTLKVNYQGRPERIRLLGIDTPESAVNPKARRDSRRTKKDLKNIILLGQQAKKYVQDRVKPGMVLHLEFDVRKNDQYGRMLAYVYLPDGRMLNEEILRDGYALVLTIPPNVKYQQRFLEAFQQARNERAGLWSGL